MKKKIYFILALTCVLNLCGCSKVFEALADGKDAVLENLINGKNALLDSAANLADDEVKDTILNAINSVNEAGGKTALQMKSFCRVNVQKEKIAILAHIRQIILAFQEQKFYLEELL